MLLTCAVVILGIRNARNSLADIIESSNKTMVLFTKENVDENDAALTKKINQITTDAVEKLKIKKRSAEKTLTILEGLVFFGVSVWTMFVLYQFKEGACTRDCVIA